MAIKKRWKQKKEEEDDWITEDGSRTVYIYKETTANPVFIRVLQQLRRVGKEMVTVTIETTC